MLGTDFARTMRAAQAGEEDAFVRLWRDANPAMVRYLRVVGHDDPYDEACEGWVTVVRGLPGFTGDETDWRIWVLACARQRAEEGTLRRTWGSATGYEGFQVEGDGDIDLEEVLEPEDAVDPTHRGISDTLTALRELPLGQGEIVVLRLGAELPPCAVASVVGVDEDNVERAEARALERLGADAELVSWSLTAPPSRAELADEKVAVGAFRKVLSRAQADKVKVIAIGTGKRRAPGRQTSPAGLVLIDPLNTPRNASRSATRGAARTNPGVAMDRWAPSTTDTRDRVVDIRSRSAARGAKVAGKSRTAALTVTALSLSLAGIGGFSAAAYVGVLPTPVQQVMHDAVGAPAPGARDGGSSTTRRQPVTSPTAGVGPSATSTAAAGLCRAWSTDKAKGTARERSVAFRNLSAAAGGQDRVEAYCATALSTKPSHGAPTASVGGTGKPTDKGTGKPTGKATGQPTDKGTGQPTGKGTGRPASTHTAQGTPAKGQPTAQATATDVTPTTKGKKVGGSTAPGSGAGTGNGNGRGAPSGG